MAFVHLQVHSEFSIRKSSARLKGILDAALADNAPAVAITDHGNLFGVMEMRQVFTPLKAIYGCHVYIDAPGANPGDTATFERLTLLVENETGYYNLLRIVSYRYMDKDRWAKIPSVPLSVIEEHKEGLIAIAGDFFSRYGQNVVAGREAQAREYLNSLTAIFDREHLYISVCDNGIPQQELLNDFNVRLAGELGREIVAVADVHYVKPEDALAHKVLRCITQKTPLKDFSDTRFPTDKFYFRSEAEMVELFGHIPGAIENTVKIAERCNFAMRTAVSDEFWPKFKIPEDFWVSEEYRRLKAGIEPASDADVYLAHLCNEAVKTNPEMAGRMNGELAAIREKHMANYILIVWDIVKWAGEHGIRVGAGRGASAASLVAYLIGITKINPLKFDLFFERFLNPERQSLPDIDIDVSDSSRVMDYVTKKYGAEFTAPVITFGLFRSGIDRLFRPDALISEVEHVLGGSAVDDCSAELIAKRLENLPRQTVVHGCKLVISPTPIYNLAPLYQASPDDRPVVAIDKWHLNDIGFLNLDILELANLSVIQDTVDLVKKNRRVEIDINHIPLDDRETLELFRSGDTDGVFQFDSPGLQKYLKQMKPDKFSDLVALNAMYRPGPIEFIPDFIKRKTGKKKVDCIHPNLEPILSETYGMVVYQEQACKIMQKIAGYRIGVADNVRRIIAKKNPERLVKLEPEFFCKAMDLGYREQDVRLVWETLLPHAGWYFCKAHAAAFAFMGFQSAYLKVHYRNEFDEVYRQKRTNDGYDEFCNL